MTVTVAVTRMSYSDGFPPGAPPAGEYGKGVDIGVDNTVDVGTALIYGYKKPGTELNPGGALYSSLG